MSLKVMCAAHELTCDNPLRILLVHLLFEQVVY